MYLARGSLQLFKPCSDIPELQEGGRLMRLVERQALPHASSLLYLWLLLVRLRCHTRSCTVGTERVYTMTQHRDLCV